MESLEQNGSTLFDTAFLAKLEQLYLVSKKIFRGQQRAERRSRQTGSSLEFADYRNYSLGDDLRNIDWNIYGRLDRLFVKLFEEEQDLPVYFLIDSSASMRWRPGGGTSKFDQARRIVASLAYIALANLDRVNVHYFGSELGDHMGMSRGKGQFCKVLEFLGRVPSGNGQTRLQTSFRTFVQRAKRRGLVFVVSDFFDPAGCEDALALLLYNRFETHIIQVLDPSELDPALLGDLRLIDAETEQSFEVTSDASLLRRYRDEINAFIANLETFCMKRQITHARASTTVPFQDFVLRILRNGRLVK